MTEDASPPETQSRPDGPPAMVLDASGGGGSVTEQEADSWFNVALVSGAKCIVIMGTANGTTPDFFNPHIVTSVEQGVPVVVLSSNYANDTGPDVSKEAPYDSQIAAAQAGATILRDVNVKAVDDVLAAINQGVAEGYQGPELNQLLIQRFGVPGGLNRYSPTK